MIDLVLYLLYNYMYKKKFDKTALKAAWSLALGIDRI
jgi:hypothetical protein